MHHNIIIHQLKKEHSVPVSRVLSRWCRLATTVSAIYLRRESLRGSSVLPSIVMKIGRTILRRWFTWTCSLQIAQPVNHLTAGSLLHHLLTLTCIYTGGYFLLLHPTVTDSFHFQKWSVLCCPDFPPTPYIDAGGRPEHCIHECKGNVNQAKSKTKVDEKSFYLKKHQKNRHYSNKYDTVQ